MIIMTENVQELIEIIDKQAREIEYLKDMLNNNCPYCLNIPVGLDGITINNFLLIQKQRQWLCDMRFQRFSDEKETD